MAARMLTNHAEIPLIISCLPRLGSMSSRRWPRWSSDQAA
jgi:hypothetical protein